MKWYVNYTPNLTQVSTTDGKGRKCVEGPYSQDQALDRRRELARNFPDAHLSDKEKAE